MSWSDAEVKLIESIDHRLESIERKVENVHPAAACGLSERVRALELQRANDKGFFAALGIFVSLIVSALISFGSKLIGNK